MAVKSEHRNKVIQEAEGHRDVLHEIRIRIQYIREQK
jgi:hypothetical protein